MELVLLDGPMGTELGARGLETPAPQWSARALVEAPKLVQDIHADYARAGATVHTTNTFRTKSRTFPDDWQQLVCMSVDLARAAVPDHHRVAGSIAPLADCYSPDLSPSDPAEEHAELAQALAALRVDLLIVETFPHLGEALAATEAAVATGVETWTALTAGPEANLLTPDEVAQGATSMARAGARVVMVNCVAVRRIEPYVQALAATGLDFGVYANAGAPEDGLGWMADAEQAAKRYADLAEGWVAAGASVVGGCCGTGPAHIAELARRFSLT